MEIDSSSNAASKPYRLHNYGKGCIVYNSFVLIRSYIADYVVWTMLIVEGHTVTLSC